MSEGKKVEVVTTMPASDVNYVGEPILYKIEALLYPELHPEAVKMGAFTKEVNEMLQWGRTYKITVEEVEEPA